MRGGSAKFFFVVVLVGGAACLGPWLADFVANLGSNPSMPLRNKNGPAECAERSFTGHVATQLSRDKPRHGGGARRQAVGYMYKCISVCV